MNELKKGFGYWAVLSLAIGSIAGSTFFFGAGLGTRYSGNLVLLAWVLVSVMAIYIAACFGELAGSFPKAGGSYEYAKQAYGKFLSFLVGWTAWLFGNLSVVVMIVGATGFLLPSLNDFHQFLISVGIIVVINAIAYVGVEASSLMLMGFAAILIAVPLLVVIKGFPAINWENFEPFFTSPLPTILVTAFFLAESYFGWESATYLAEETNNARKTIPKALVHATTIIAILGFMLLLTMLGIKGWQGLSGQTFAFADIARGIFSGRLAQAVVVGAFLALIGSAAGGIVALPRLVLALARDRLFPGQFQAIHPRFKTPHNAILFQTVILVLLLLLGFANYEILLSMMIPMGTLMYLTILFTVPILRAKFPAIERPFKVPFPRLGIAAVSAALLAAVAAWSISIQGSLALLQLSISIVAIGLPLYLLVELYYDPKMITEMNDILSYVTLFTEKITFHKKIKKEIFAFLGDLNGKTVLEFGCGVGTLTLDLAKKAGLKGTIYATHFSKNNLKITSKRVDDLKWGTDYPISQVKMIHDTEMFKRVPPEVAYADVVVSAGMLSYIHDMEKVLKELWAIMPANGKVCFTDYTDFFHVLPNVEWLSSEAKIEETFRKARFSVRVVKTKGLFWNRIFLYGVKTKESMAFI